MTDNRPLPDDPEPSISEPDELPAGVVSVDDSVVVMGLDGEMSSPSLQEGGRLIQVGLAAATSEGLSIFCEKISWGTEMAWDDRAARVHGLSRADLDSAPPSHQVDERCHAWLLAHGATVERRLVIGCGFNVGAFDYPFFRHALPRSMTLVSRRALDLNSLCFALAGWDPLPTATPRDWAGWKRSAKRAAARRLESAGHIGREHDAGYDAALALTILEWFREQLAAGRRRMTPTDRNPVLTAVFGPRILAHLTSVPTSVLLRLAGLLLVHQMDARAWMGVSRRELGGSSPIEALCADDHEQVFALFE